MPHLGREPGQVHRHLSCTPTPEIEMRLLATFFAAAFALFVFGNALARAEAVPPHQGAAVIKIVG